VTSGTTTGKLKTISWFAKLMDWLTGIRDRRLAWARATRVWALSVQFKRTARILVEKVRLRFRIGRGHAPLPILAIILLS
jgi:hypothetical protein